MKFLNQIFVVSSISIYWTFFYGVLSYATLLKFLCKFFHILQGIFIVVSSQLLIYKCILYIFFVVYSVNDRYKINRKKL